MKKRSPEEIPKTLYGLIYKVLFYKTKELFLLMLILLVAWAMTLIMIPELATSIKAWMIGRIK